jgi:transposase-like protein
MAHWKRRSDRAGRKALRSPGRPPAARRDELLVFWASIAAGRSSEAAAIDAGVSPAVGVRWFRRAGGMAPAHLSRSSKRLSGRYLSFAEREEIAILHSQKCGVCEIARRLGRAASTISRELRRNASTRNGGLEYRATTAQWHADRSARRPKPSKLAMNDSLRHYVQDRLSGVIASADGVKISGPMVRWKGRRSGPRQHRRWAAAWSPEQIASRLLLDFPADEEMRISHEATHLRFLQPRGWSVPSVRESWAGQPKILAIDSIAPKAEGTYKGMAEGGYTLIRAVRGPTNGVHFSMRRPDRHESQFSTGNIPQQRNHCLKCVNTTLP